MATKVLFMKVSIITACYNSAATIGTTVQSVTAQQYPHIEHLLIDGLSTDDTLAVAAAAGHQGPVYSEKDKGIYDAMNKGIARATGDIIAILNSDDFYAHPQVISEVVALFQQQQCDTVYGDLWYVHPLETSKVLRKWHSGAYHRAQFLNGWMPPHPTFFVHKRLYEQWGHFHLGLGSAADYELMLRFLYKHGASAAYLPNVLVHMRAGGASNQSIANRLAANKNDRKAWAINGLQPRFYTLFLKPLRKVTQFLVRH